MKTSNLAERLEEFEATILRDGRAEGKRTAHGGRGRLRRTPPSRTTPPARSTPRRIQIRDHGSAPFRVLLTTRRGLRREDRRQRTMQHRADRAQQLAFLHRELLVVRDAADQALDEHLLGERPQVAPGARAHRRAPWATARSRGTPADVRAAPPRCRLRRRGARAHRRRCPARRGWRTACGWRRFPAAAKRCRAAAPASSSSRGSRPAAR